MSGENSAVIDLVHNDDDDGSNGAPAAAAHATAVVDLTAEQDETYIDKKRTGGSDGMVIDLTASGKRQKTNEEEWDILLIVDSQEPKAFYEALLAHIPCEQRRLPVFDYLWIARNKNSGKELVLDYGCERKRIDDLGASLDAKHGLTKLSRNDYQRLNMMNSQLTHQYYLVQGKIKDVGWKYRKFSNDFFRRIHARLKELKQEDGMTVVHMELNNKQQFVEWMKNIHETVMSEFDARQPFRTMEDLKARTRWVNRLGQHRGKLGAKRLRMILQAFPATFEASYQQDSEQVIKDLVNLNTDSRRGISKANAVSLCQGMFGENGEATTTTTTAKAAPNIVTPEKRKQR